MAQFNFAEKIEIEELHIEPTDVMTGDRNKSRYLLYQLKLSMARAKQIDIIVSFLMESGVRMLLSDLKAALQRGVRIRILTGNYLGITQPSALYLLKRELGDKVELRFYSDKGRSFHPKSYIFHYDNMSEIYIGSSNISRSALTSGIEWNYRFNNNQDSQNFNLFYETFEDLFKNHSYVINDAELKAYSKNWHKPAVAKDLARYDQVDPDTKVEMLFQPRGAQIEALCALENSRAEGAVRGLVHAATGVGKTYLAAFDSAKYERVLFVAHREEILKQAAVSFKNVRHSDDYGFFDGKQKDTGKSVIFAFVATLGRSEYLTEEYFASDYFTYLVIDEFHHAVTDQYQRIVNYFKPQFMLGLTATPERMDGKSIYEICDYNVPYEITLKEAINKGALVPFHYYGIYDETDYSTLKLVKGRYNENDLNDKYIGNERYYRVSYDGILSETVCREVIISIIYSRSNRVDCEVSDMLKNVLIVVDDIEKSIEFYRDLFGLQVILQNEGNVILSEGLVLQDAGLWGKTLDEISTPFNNRMELYFEEFDIDRLLAKYESGKYFARYATELTEIAGGQKLVRLYDPSGNLIEVRTPFMCN